MSELTLVLIRFAYLAILWIFVLSCISVIRSDMFGARVARQGADRGQSRSERRPKGKSKAKPSKPRRGVPTQVVIVEGGNKGEAVSLEKAPLLIGRGNDADLRIDDPGVSRKHIEIRVEEPQDVNGEPRITVHDLGSTNGMSVNGRRVEKATLADGATIRIGNTTMSLRLRQG